MKFSSWFSNTTMDSIISSLTGMVKELEAHNVAKTAEAFALMEQTEGLRARSEAAILEATKAAAISANLSKIINPTSAN